MVIDKKKYRLICMKCQKDNDNNNKEWKGEIRDVSLCTNVMSENPDFLVSNLEILTW